MNYSHLKVLLVDDDISSLKITQLFFKKLSISPNVATTGMEAIEKIKKENYDLVLLDSVMPEMSGHETCKEIRKLEKSIRPFVLGISANNSKADREKCLNAGMDDTLFKPFSKLGLIDKIEEHFQSLDY